MGEGGGTYFPYILLNEIQTMILLLVKRSSDHPIIIGLVSGFVYRSCAFRQKQRSTVLRRNKNMAVEGGSVSHYFILVIRKFIDFMSLFRHSVWFSFLL